jgi:hypothetical protein
LKERPSKSAYMSETKTFSFISFTHIGAFGGAKRFFAKVAPLGWWELQNSGPGLLKKATLEWENYNKRQFMTGGRLFFPISTLVLSILGPRSYRKDGFSLKKRGTCQKVAIPGVKNPRPTGRMKGF